MAQRNKMTQEQLVAALKCQHPGAVEELVSLYGDRLLRSAFVLFGNETEAQDMVQETFLEAARAGTSTGRDRSLPP